MSGSRGRESIVLGAGGVVTKEAVKRGARGQKQGGRPSKTRKFDLIEEDWGMKTTKNLEDDLNRQMKTTGNATAKDRGAEKEEGADELLTVIGSSILHTGAALSEEGSQTPLPPKAAPDVQIMVQPGSLAARKYSSSQKLFRTSPAVCQIYL